MRGVILDKDSLSPADLNLSPVLDTLDAWEQHSNTQPADTLSRIVDADIILTNKVVITAEHIKASPNLKMIGIMATGTNNVDIAAAHDHGIQISNATDYGTHSVAQHTFALIFALSSRILSYGLDVAMGRWQKSDFFCRLDHPIVELNNKNLVICGYGKIGQAVASIGTALGMNIHVASRPGEASNIKDNIQRTPLEELSKIADVISLHCPLTNDTANMIDRRMLQNMKSTSLLINCGRGGLVEEAALSEALQAGIISGAGLDVLRQEPPSAENPLLNQVHPNLIITPHCAWGSLESRQQLINITGENIQAFLRGTPQNSVLP